MNFLCCVEHADSEKGSSAAVLLLPLTQTPKIFVSIVFRLFSIEIFPNPKTQLGDNVNTINSAY